MDSKKADEVRRSVRDAYAQVVQAQSQGTRCGEANSCCGVPPHTCCVRVPFGSRRENCRRGSPLTPAPTKVD